MNTEFVMQQLQDGLMISIIGMLVVMVFLTVMMYVLKFSEVVMKELNKFFPEEIEAPKKATPSNNNTGAEIAVAIAAAVKRMKA